MIALLESALAQPQAPIGGEYVHDGLFAMAGAYLFHIVSNRPFVDGNKRAGLLSALVFLDINGVTIGEASDALYELTWALLKGESASRRSRLNSRVSRAWNDDSRTGVSGPAEEARLAASEHLIDALLVLLEAGEVGRATSLLRGWRAGG